MFLRIIPDIRYQQNLDLQQYNKFIELNQYKYENIKNKLIKLGPTELLN